MSMIKALLLGLVLSIVSVNAVSDMQVGALGLVAKPTLVSSAAKTDACKGVSQLDGSSADDCVAGTGGGAVLNVSKVVVNIMSAIVGIAAVIMIIISGLRYVTSAGDSGRVSSAKNGLIYALIGIAIAALAQVLVSVVLKATK